MNPCIMKDTQHREGTHSPEAARELQFWVNLPAAIISNTASELIRFRTQILLWTIVSQHAAKIVYCAKTKGP